MSGPVAPSRIEWVDRQLEAGADLRAALRFLDARRARHLRGAHGTWGVALGFDVDATTTTLLRTTTVGAGLAYDASGRELLLDRRQRIVIPAEASGAVTLVVASRGDLCVPEVELRVAWPGRPLRLGREVPLATIDLATGLVDRSTRPHIRSAAPPRVAGARVEVGGAAAQGSSLAFTVAVDTSAGSFEADPLYLVEPMLGSAAPDIPPGLLGPLLTVESATPQGFSLVVRYLAATAVRATAAAALARPVFTAPFAFAWVGVEPPPAAGIHAGTTPPPLPVL